MCPGMMPILHSPGVMTPGQFGPIRIEAEPSSARFTRIMSRTGMPSVMATISGIFASSASRIEFGREGRRHVDHGGIGAGLLHRLVDGVEDGEVEVGLPALAGRHASDHRRAVGDGLLRVEGALGAGEALADHAGGLVDEDAHSCLFPA